jgi:tetratricopeptide (TPR) repeat protein
VAVDHQGTVPGARIRQPLVGRAAEWHELASALDDAREGHGTLFLIDGEAGIGKTRLAEAFADHAADESCTVLWGGAWDSAGAPAYWPWTQALRELVQSRPAEEILEDLGHGGPYVAQIAPELGRRLLRATDELPSLETEDARFTAFDATASFLRAAAARRPIVIVLDDLHAADVATVRLLEFLARNLYGARILAIGTCRMESLLRDSELATAVGDLGNTARRLVLGGMSLSEVGALTGARAGSEPAPELVERLHELTEGNPLFVEEVMRLLPPDGAFAAVGRLPLPDAVTEIIRRRLDPVPRAVREALTAAAVIGPAFDLETLARVLGKERGTLLGELDAAADAGLVIEVPGRLGRYRFTHALIRETLYDGLSRPRRVDLHGVIGESLLDMHGTGPEAPLDELAHHFLESAPVADPLRAAVFAARAGERALDSMAYERAIELFDAALGALELQPGGAEQRARLRMAKGETEMRCGRLEAGRATLRKAAEDARMLGDTEVLARAALASAPWGLATAMSDEADLIPLLKETRASLPAEDGALRARATARLASAMYWSAPAADREALGEQAIAMARRLGDPATLAWVLSDVHLATWHPDSLERALEWMAEIDELAEHVGNIELAMVARSWRISLLLERGGPGTRRVIDQEVVTFARTAVQLHQQRAQAQSLIHRCAVALMEGRFEDAERRLGEAAEYGSLLQQDLTTQMRVSALAFIMRECQGRLGELEPAVQHFAAAHPVMPVWRCALVAVYLQTDREPELRREYRRLAAGGFAALPHDNLWLPALALLTGACVRLGDRAGATHLRAQLEPYSGRNVVAPDVVYLGPVDGYLALAAAVEGDREAASAYFASAREQAGEMGARPTVARLALDEATVLGSAVPDDVLAEAEAMGLGWLMRAPEPHARPRMVRRGDHWEVSFGGPTFYVKLLKGMNHLSRLLAAPGEELHALDLVGVSRAPAQGDLGPLLDPQAKAAYGARITELKQEIQQAEAFNDPERACRGREELDAIATQLEAAVGLRGRDRRPGASAEKARLNVKRAIDEAIRRMGHHDDALGHHLKTCVQTGTFCVYTPPPDAEAWEVDPGS